MVQAKQTQGGFAHAGVLAIIAVVVVISGVAIWRIRSANTNTSLTNSTEKNVITGQLTNEDRERASLLKTAPSAASSTPQTSQTQPSSSSSTTSIAQQPKTNTPPKASTSTSTSSAPAAPPANPTPKPTTTSTYQRPTTEFCNSKNGASFTNAWVTDNSSHTYKIWVNGAETSFTETGTAAYNFDSMKVVGVIPFKAQAKWAICTYGRPNYVTFYYQPSGSVYTYNWIVAFNDITLVQP